MEDERNIDYQTLIKGIFVWGFPSVNNVINNENIKAVIDLRAEAKEGAFQGDSIEKGKQLLKEIRPEIEIHPEL